MWEGRVKGHCLGYETCEVDALLVAGGSDAAENLPAAFALLGFVAA